MDQEEIIEHIQSGDVGVLPTDTLYGLVGSALIPETVEKIYALKHRNPEKPLIVLIADIVDVEQFGCVLSKKLIKQLETYWPGPTSIILPTLDETFDYLDRGTHSVAFRLPNNDDLCDLIRQTGPIVAPSANKEGEPPAATIDAAKKIFGSSISFYQDGGTLKGKPSQLIELDEEGKTTLLRG